MPDATPRSSRFLQATRSELKRLDRRRSQLSKKREDLQARLDALDVDLEAVDQEMIVLGGIAGSSTTRPELTIHRADDHGRQAGHPDDQLQKILKGSRIRELAVPVLLDERGTAPVHYREWLQLLEDVGYSVAGKRPEAVFLNQVVRSPLVRATTQAGYYEINLDAPEQLRERLRTEQRELAAHVQFAPQHQEALAEHRDRQRELNAAIARTQRELDEALSVLEDAGTQARSSDVRAA
jgi:prefoldin subunit 5